MSFAGIWKSCRDLTQKFAAKSGARIDARRSPRRVHLEHSSFVLGADAIPAPVHIPGHRR